MKNKLIKNIISIFSITTLLLMIAVYFMYSITTPKYSIHPDLSDNKYFIAHATGSIEGYTYLNSKESLLNSLENGYKYIEIDIQYTSDSNLVCVHDWEQFNKTTIPNLLGRDSDKYMRIPSLEEFKARKIYGKYTPLTIDDVIEIQKNTPFTIVTDIISDSNSLNRYFNKETRSNVMVETFSEKDYYELKKCGYIPMLSVGCINHINCLSFIASHLINNDIEWIAVEQHSSIRSLRLLKKLFGLRIALYTVNSSKFFKWHLGSDIDLIYTDNWNLKTQLNTFQDNNTH